MSRKKMIAMFLIIALVLVLATSCGRVSKKKAAAQLAMAEAEYAERLAAEVAEKDRLIANSIKVAEEARTKAEAATEAAELAVKASEDVLAQAEKIVAEANSRVDSALKMAADAKTSADVTSGRMATLSNENADSLALAVEEVRNTAALALQTATQAMDDTNALSAQIFVLNEQTDNLFGYADSVLKEGLAAVDELETKIASVAQAAAKAQSTADEAANTAAEAVSGVAALDTKTDAIVDEAMSLLDELFAEGLEIADEIIAEGFAIIDELDQAIAAANTTALEAKAASVLATDAVAALETKTDALTAEALDLYAETLDAADKAVSSAVKAATAAKETADLAIREVTALAAEFKILFSEQIGSDLVAEGIDAITSLETALDAAVATAEEAKAEAQKAVATAAEAVQAAAESKAEAAKAAKSVAALDAKTDAIVDEALAIVDEIIAEGLASIDEVAQATTKAQDTADEAAKAAAKAQSTADEAVKAASEVKAPAPVETPVVVEVQKQEKQAEPVVEKAQKPAVEKKDTKHRLSVDYGVCGYDLGEGFASDVVRTLTYERMLTSDFSVSAQLKYRSQFAHFNDGMLSYGYAFTKYFNLTEGLKAFAAFGYGSDFVYSEADVAPYASLSTGLVYEVTDSFALKYTLGVSTGLSVLSVRPASIGAVYAF